MRRETRFGSSATASSAWSVSWRRGTNSSARRDEMLGSTVAGLQAQLRRQRIELLLVDLGGNPKWARLYGIDVAEGREPPEPNEHELADWIRVAGLEPMVSKPLPVPLRLGPADELTAAHASKNGTRGGDGQ
jgi:hypothetical protein